MFFTENIRSKTPRRSRNKAVSFPWSFHSFKPLVTKRDEICKNGFLHFSHDFPSFTDMEDGITMKKKLWNKIFNCQLNCWYVVNDEANCWCKNKQNPWLKRFSGEIYMKNVVFTTSSGIGNLHLTNGTHWVVFVDEFFSDSVGLALHLQ